MPHTLLFGELTTPISSTVATYSGTMTAFRQGVSIRTISQFSAHVGGMMGGPDNFRTVLSGSTISENFFNDAAAGIGSELLGTRIGYQTIINHEMDEYNYGQLVRNELPISGARKMNPFREQSMPVTGSPDNYLFLTQPENTASLPLRLRYKSIVSLGQTDGAIEAFSIRKLVDNTAPLSIDRRPRIHANLSSMGSDESFPGPSVPSPAGPAPCPWYPIVQEINFAEKLDYPAGSIIPFDDRTSGLSGSMTLQIQFGQVTDVPRYERAGPYTPTFYRTFVTSSPDPFSDSTRREGQEGALFSSVGRGLAPVDATIQSYLHDMTSSYENPMFDKQTYGSTAGSVFAISHLTGWRMGTDSIAFGGWKK